MASVRYIVNDVDRSAEFYRNLLEFELDKHNPGKFAALKHEDLTLYLRNIDGTGWTARTDNRAVVERPPQGSIASITVRTPIAGKFEAGVPPLPIEFRAGETAALPSIDFPRREG